MATPARTFIRQFVGVVAATLMAVAAVAFVSIPINLGGHPGDARPAEALVGQHMT
jgi:hypothetical protein